MGSLNCLRQALAYLWASPYTLAGLLLGGIGLCTGGRARVRGRIIEFYGGGIKWLIQRFPDGSSRRRRQTAQPRVAAQPLPWVNGLFAGLRRRRYTGRNAAAGVALAS
jgi:hypothetical protein